MKKLQRAEKKLRRRNRLVRRSAAERSRFKLYRKKKNKEEGSLRRPERKVHREKLHQAVSYEEIVAPQCLSFVRNPEQVISFISQIKNCFDRKKPVWVVLNHVIDIDYDGILVLLSVVVRFKSHGIRFNGDLPKNIAVRKVLTDSGFFRHLTKSSFSDQDSYSLTAKSSILTHAKRTVDPELSANLITSASLTVWNEERRCPGIQRALIELMQNTNNHASLEREGDKHWWLSVRHEPDSNIVRFAFVDYGVGVFVNLRNKRQGNKFYGAFDALLGKLVYGNNSDVLKLIFQGDLHRTATGKYYRGKGLPGVYEVLQKNQFSNLTMITNDVYFNSNDDSYRMLNTSFQGTFVSWELNTGNISIK